MNIKERIERHLRQLAPHVRERETGNLLFDALVEIKSLRDKLENLEVQAVRNATGTGWVCIPEVEWDSIMTPNV